MHKDPSVDLNNCTVRNNTGHDNRQTAEMI